MKLSQIRSVKGPVILFIVSLVLVVALLVLWNVKLSYDYQRLRVLTEQSGAGFWTFIGLGSALFVTTIVLLSVIGSMLIYEIRQSQRIAAFVATFTHELNSPLASIKLFAQTLRRPGLKPDEQARFLDLILADVERLRGQISNVLRTAQVDAPLGLQVVPELVDLNAWLEDDLSGRRLALERQGGRASLELVPLASGPAPARIDRGVFRQVIDNLVDNAVKYKRPEATGARVQVLVMPGSRAETVAIEVRDDGCGIHESELERVFERFGRAEQGNSSRVQGTGLGLWIVRTIVEAHDGEVWAASPGLGQGTTVRIELPRAGATPPAAPSDQPPGPGDAPDSAALVPPSREVHP